MPVECSVAVNPVRQERFHAVDKVVMRHAFDIHNSLGRFCDEGIYQEELAQRCRASGLEVHREVQLRVTHEAFVKCYYLDMLLEHGIIDELKAVEALNSNHENQLINYLLLAGLCHGKLVNFRSGSVKSRFVSTRLSRQDRITFQLLDAAWDGNDDVSRTLRGTLCALLADWGTCLDVGLYREALLHFLDGSETGIQPVDIEVAGRIVGTQKMCLLNRDTVWHLSTVRRGLESYETHITRLMNHTRLERIHWINLNQREALLKTIKR
jgi:GxxExxY protein